VALEASLSGRLVRRYKRFFADVALGDGRVLTVHCPNPGSMLGLDVAGAPVRCSTSANPARRLAHTLEMIRPGRAWVGLHTTRANALVDAALRAGAVPGFEGYASVRREVAAGDGSRLDFLLEGRPGDARPAWLEVKSATLAAGRCARFPDTLTLRGRRHLETLAKLRAAGARAALVFVIQRADCTRFEPADEIDPGYGAALRAAVREGVEVLALRARVSPRALVLGGAAPVRL
jgi:sugar fermentation stimulation protein A